MDTGLPDELPPALARLLRRAVLDHATSEPRKTFPARLHVGTPGARQRVLAVDEEANDHALRTDCVAAMLSRAAAEPAPGPVVWLTRPGDLDLQDVDARWLAAALAAAGEAGRPLTMVVVNKHGWRDPRSGAARHWKRMRRR